MVPSFHQRLLTRPFSNPINIAQQQQQQHQQHQQHRKISSYGNIDEKKEMMMMMMMINNNKTTSMGGSVQHAKDERRPETAKNITTNSTDSNKKVVKPRAGSISSLPFPYKLYKLLDEAPSSSPPYDHVVSWLPDGTGFKIHNMQEFCENIMETCCGQSQFKSFTRQLYLYGFLKICEQGRPNEGAFYHPEFVKGDRKACLSIRRNQFQGDRRQSKVKQASSNVAASAAASAAAVQVKKKRTTKSKKKTTTSTSTTTSATSKNKGSKGQTTKKNKAAKKEEHTTTSTSTTPPDHDAATTLNNSSGSGSNNNNNKNKTALTLFDQVFNLIDHEEDHIMLLDDDDDAVDALVFDEEPSRSSIIVPRRTNNQQHQPMLLPPRPLLPPPPILGPSNSTMGVIHSISLEPLLATTTTTTTATSTSTSILPQTAALSASKDEQQDRPVDWFQNVLAEVDSFLEDAPHSTITDHPQDPLGGALPSSWFLLDDDDFAPRPIEEMMMIRNK